MSLSPNVVWQQTSVDRAARDLKLGTRGATVWFTGLPSSGKSTLAAAVEERLTGAGVSAYVLDGDNLRHGLNGDLGFDAYARAENVRRTAHVARLLADAGLVALVSLVSPYAADRALARRLHDDAGIPFVEIFLSAPLSVCEQRDPKGLYARARKGRSRGSRAWTTPTSRRITLMSRSCRRRSNAASRLSARSLASAWRAAGGVSRCGARDVHARRLSRHPH